MLTNKSCPGPVAARPRHPGGARHPVPDPAAPSPLLVATSTSNRAVPARRLPFSSLWFQPPIPRRACPTSQQPQYGYQSRLYATACYVSTVSLGDPARTPGCRFTRPGSPTPARPAQPRTAAPPSPGAARSADSKLDRRPVSKLTRRTTKAPPCWSGSRAMLACRSSRNRRANRRTSRSAARPQPVRQRRPPPPSARPRARQRTPGTPPYSPSEGRCAGGGSTRPYSCRYQRFHASKERQPPACGHSTVIGSTLLATTRVSRHGPASRPARRAGQASDASPQGSGPSPAAGDRTLPVPGE
jgi:hypothetical protein